MKKRFEKDYLRFVNLSKSTMYPIMIGSSKMNSLSDDFELNRRVSSLPSNQFLHQN